MKRKKIIISAVFLIALFASCGHEDPNKEYLGVRLLNAIEYKDLSAVKRYIQEGADINNIHRPFLRGGDISALLFAAREYKTETAEYLIKSGADVNARGLFGRTPLMAAVSSGNVKLTDLLIEKGADVNAKQFVDDSVLDQAVERGDTALVEKLIARGAKATRRDLNSAMAKEYGFKIIFMVLQQLKKNNISTGLSPFMEAIILGDADKVRNQIKRGANFREQLPDKSEPSGPQKKGGKSAILIASALGYEDIAGQLLDAGIDVNNNSNSWNLTPLILACSYGNTGLVKYFLKRGADINEESAGGYTLTPLSAAVNENYPEIVRLLVEAGAHMEDGNELFTDAAKNGNVEIMDYLVKKGIKMNKVCVVKALESQHLDVIKYIYKHPKYLELARGSDMGLYFACLSNRPDIVKFVISSGVSANMREHGDGRTFLQLAAQEGNGEIVEYLLSHGADPNLVALYKDSSVIDNCLMDAAYAGHVDVVKLLVKYKIKLNYTNKKGKNALQYAALSDNAEITEFLIKSGMDVNHRDSEGNTALIDAVTRGSLDAVKILLKYKADKTVKNNKGVSAFDLAKSYKISLFIDELEKK